MWTFILPLGQAPWQAHKELPQKKVTSLLILIAEFIPGGKKGRPPSTPVPHDGAKLLQFNTQLDNYAFVLFGQTNKLQSEQAAFYLHDAWSTGNLDLQDAEQHLAPNGIGFAIMPTADQFANAVVALAASKELAYWNFSESIGMQPTK